MEGSALAVPATIGAAIGSPVEKLRQVGPLPTRARAAMHVHERAPLLCLVLSGPAGRRGPSIAPSPTAALTLVTAGVNSRFRFT
jgi:hypothetical protein